MMRYGALVCCAVLAVVIWLSGNWGPIARAQTGGPLYTVDVDGVFTSVSSSYLERALREAEAADATALIINLHGEGAVLSAVRPFAGTLAAAKIPVVVYVAPAGSTAGAAGAFLLSAAHLSALAPGASFGSATPLAQVDAVLSEQSRNLVLDSVAKQLRDWNERQGRNAAWIDRAVSQGVILNSEQASATNPPSVNLVAGDENELLTLLEGRTVKLDDGRQVQLTTLGRTTEPIAPTLWEQLRLLLASPTVAFMLLVMGGAAIYAELANPGTSVFAGIGVVLMLASLLGLIVLPVRWLSVAGIIAAFGLVGTDLFVPSHGGLTVAGLALLVVSALTLVDPAQAPGVSVALWLVVLVALALAAFAALGLWFALRSRTTPVRTGSESMIGQVAEVRQRLDPEGMVFVEGALWTAVSENGAVEPGEWVQVVAIHNLHLLVRPFEHS